jgi:hypothetical protein
MKHIIMQIRTYVKSVSVSSFKNFLNKFWYLYIIIRKGIESAHFYKISYISNANKS